MDQHLLSFRGLLPDRLVIKKNVVGQHQWLTPIQEAEIRRIMVWSHPRQIVLETLSQKTLHKNRTGGVAQGESPEFKHQYCKKRKEKCSKPNVRVKLNSVFILASVVDCRIQAMNSSHPYMHILCNVILMVFLQPQTWDPFLLTWAHTWVCTCTYTHILAWLVTCVD
jgi:hypothetical protein